MSSSGNKLGITIFFTKSNFDIVISPGGNKHGYKLMCWIHLHFWMVHESSSVSGGWANMCLVNCGFPEPNLVWKLPGRDIRCISCDILETKSRDFISSPNAVCTSVAAGSSNRGLTTAGTVHSIMLCFVCPVQKESTMSPHSGLVSSVRLICVSWNLFMCCCTSLEIVRNN